MVDLRGHKIGRYEIDEIIGEGGMATVYLAQDIRLERNVAVKFIKREVLPSNILDQMLKRFEREAKSLARMSHPNIVKVYDYGEYEETPYLVMEYVGGGTLKQLVSEGYLSYGDSIKSLIPIARALEYAHSMGVVHRDVKPVNILMTENGDPMLSDFGIAKILESTEGMTLTGTGIGIGTPEYMAPEQSMAQSVDHRADVYSLGVVLFELVTGQRPFVADTPMGVIIKHVSEQVPQARTIMPDLPENVDAVIHKAMAKDPADRFQTMGEMANALEILVNARITGNYILGEVLHSASIKNEVQSPSGMQKKEGHPSAQYVVARYSGMQDPTPPSGIHRQLNPSNNSAFPLSGSKSFDGVQSPSGEYLPPASNVIRERDSNRYPVPSQGAPLTVEPVSGGYSQPPQKKGDIRGKRHIWVWVGLAILAVIFLGVGFGMAAFMGAKSFTSNSQETQQITYSLKTLTVQNIMTKTPAGGQESNNVTPVIEKTISPVGLGEKLPLPAQDIAAKNASRVIELGIWEMDQAGAQIAYSSDSKYLAGNQKAILYLWSTRDGEIYKKFEKQKGDITAIAFSPDGNNIITGSKDASTRIYSINDEVLKSTMTGFLSEGWEVTCIAQDPANNGVAVGYAKGWVTSNEERGPMVMYNTDSTSRFMNVFQDEISSVAFSPTGKLLAAGAKDGEIRIWRSNTGKLVYQLKAQGGVVSLIFPSEEELFTGSGAGVQLWSLSSSEAVATFDEAPVTTMIISPDRDLLVAGGYDRIKILDIVEKAVVKEILVKSEVSSLAFSPDNNYIAAALEDGTIHIYGIPPK